MELRTAPRSVSQQLLVANQPGLLHRKWTFDLNPALTWDDVSPETKLRLKTLAQETVCLYFPIRLTPYLVSCLNSQYNFAGDCLCPQVPQQTKL